MKPHKHAELIKAWADGAVIEALDCGHWYECVTPDWEGGYKFRIKPEPKPDVDLYALVDNPTLQFHRWVAKVTDAYQTPPDPHNNCNLKLTFDGETGELKSAEVLK